MMMTQYMHLLMGNAPYNLIYYMVLEKKLSYFFYIQENLL